MFLNFTLMSLPKFEFLYVREKLRKSKKKSFELRLVLSFVFESSPDVLMNLTRASNAVLLDNAH